MGTSPPLGQMRWLVRIRADCITDGGSAPRARGAGGGRGTRVKGEDAAAGNAALEAGAAFAGGDRRRRSGRGRCEDRGLRGSRRGSAAREKRPPAGERSRRARWRVIPLRGRLGQGAGAWAPVVGTYSAARHTARPRGSVVPGRADDVGTPEHGRVGQRAGCASGSPMPGSRVRCSPREPEAGDTGTADCRPARRSRDVMPRGRDPSGRRDPPMAHQARPPSR